MTKMVTLNDLIEFMSGTPQFRIVESRNNDSSEYLIYNQTDLREDLYGAVSDRVDNKIIRTDNKVTLLSSGDLLFSLVSGEAVIIKKEHEGYLYTQNYIKLIPKDTIDPKFLAFYLNESDIIRRQFKIGLQGSTVIKYTLMQLREINIPKLPSLEKQKLIGDIYFKQLKLQALRNRRTNLETKKIMYLLEEELKNE